MALKAKMIFLPLLLLFLIPITAYAYTVNENFNPSVDDSFGGVIPDSNDLGPVGIVNELRQAHSDLSGIMERQSNGDFTTPDYPFVMTYVDDDELVVMMHGMAALVGIEYEEEELQIALDADIPIEIIYGEFVLEVSQSRILSWQQYYIDHCSPVQAGYQAVCTIFGGYLRDEGINPDSLVSLPIIPEIKPTPISTSPCDVSSDSLACYYYTRYIDRCLPTITTSRCNTYVTQITTAGYALPTLSGTTTPIVPTIPVEKHPTNVVATLNDGTMTVTWTAPSYEVEKYKVYPYEDNKRQSRVYVTTESFTYNSIEEGSDYKFKVRAYYEERQNGRGSSSYVYSNVVSVPVSEPEPVIPEPLKIAIIPEIQFASATQEVYGGMPILSYGTFLIDGLDPYVDGTLGIITEGENNIPIAITVSHVVPWKQFSSINLDNGDRQISHPEIGTNIISSTHVEKPNTSTSADAVSILVNGIGIEPKLNQIKTSDTILNVTKFGGLNELLYPLVEKSGRHGTSSGTVNYQNVTVVLSNDRLSFVLTNQASVVGMSSKAGDSGSPIYIKNNETAQLVGLLTGYTCEFTLGNGAFMNITYVDDYNNHVCDEDTGNKLTILSTWENIVKELGI